MQTTEAEPMRVEFCKTLSTAKAHAKALRRKGIDAWHGIKTTEGYAVWRMP